MTYPSGLREPFFLDGAAFSLPQQTRWHNIMAHSVSPAAGRPRMDSVYMGAGLPNKIDRFEWELPYELGGSTESMVEDLEAMRTSGAVYLFTDWKERVYTWTVRAAQQFLYLPREDAFGRSYSGHTTQATYGATVTINGGAALTVTYQATVATGDSVAAGNVYIGRNILMHPDAGFTVAPFKIGTTLSRGDKVKVVCRYLFRVVVSDVATVPFETNNREDKTLYLIEVP